MLAYGASHRLRYQVFADLNMRRRKMSEVVRRLAGGRQADEDNELGPLHRRRTMSRYVKKFKSTTALGPTEERGFALWAGYEIDGVTGDLSNAGLLNVDDWSEEELRDLGVTTFTRIERSEVALYEKLGISGLVISS